MTKLFKRSMPALVLLGAITLPLAGCEREDEFQTPRGEIEVERERDGDIEVDRD